MNIIIFGLGSIGSRHARLLHEHFPEVNLFRWRRSRAKPSHLDYVLDISSREDIQSLNSPTALISTPSAHLDIAIWLTGMGVSNFFIEKPIDTVFSAEKIKKLSKYRVFVGYPFSFLEVPEWVKTARNVTFTCLTNASKWPGQRKIDHILLELSHEFYLAEAIFGPVKALKRLSEPSSTFGLYITEHGDTMNPHTCGFALDLAWRGKPRRDIEGPDGAVFSYRADDALYLRQLTDLVEHVRKGVRFEKNSLESCVPLFEKICKAINK